MQNTLKVIGDIATSCPKTKVGVMGYSQGGNVASTVLRLIGAGQGSIDPSRVAMGMVFSDPTRTAGSPPSRGGLPRRPFRIRFGYPRPGSGTARRTCAGRCRRRRDRSADRGDSDELRCPDWPGGIGLCCR
ncbi:cutinase family protein [Rhodococcus hoagii]|nr:cutinase family protein [Prescottella equi]